MVSSSSRNIPHVGALDELRGVAALLVLFAHITHNLTRGIDQTLGAWIKPHNPLFAVLAEGHAGVSLFMVLSGFLFAYGAHKKDVMYFPFIKNRVIRIYPMYILMLILGSYTNSAQFNFLNFLSSLLLFSNTGSALNGGAFTALLWTISVEFMFYLIFPFVSKFKNSMGVSYLYKLIILSIILRLICIGLGANARDLSYFSIIGRIDQFLIGMILAHHYREGSIQFIRPRLSLIVSSALIIASLYLFNRVGGWERISAWKGIWHTYEGLVFGFLIVSYLSCADRMNELYKNVLGGIGTISFSIYLIHMPILILFQNKHLYATVTNDLYLNAVVTALYFVPLVIFVSICTYKMVEEPFMSMRAKYLRELADCDSPTRKIGGRFLAAVLVFLVAGGAEKATAFEYDYSKVKYDLTEKAVLGSKSDFEQWRQEPLSYIRDKFQNVALPDPEIVSRGAPTRKDGYTLTPVELIFRKATNTGENLQYVAVIARPDVPKPLPVLIAINGHSDVGGEGHGQAPATVFIDGAYGDYLARHGFTVIALPNTIHREFAKTARDTDYSIIWARLADKAFAKLKSEFPAETKYVSIGNAAGGLTSLVLAIMRPDIEALVTNGALFSLEHTRREYRIYGHPFCHDFAAFFSYSPVYALMAPKPLMIQVGQKDGLWLGHGPAKPLSWFSGTKRGAISDETVGAYLQIREVWSKYSTPIALHVQSGGHEDFDGAAAEAFIEGLKIGRNTK